MKNESVSIGTLPTQPVRISEKEFLQEQQALASLALRRTAAELKDDLKRCADPTLWVRKYPLRSMIAAFSLGFALTRSREGDVESGNGAADRKASQHKSRSTGARLTRVVTMVLKSAMLGRVS